MKTDLDAFLREVALRPIQPSGCGLPVADLWLAEYGVDAMADFRNAYHDEASCDAMLAAHGHLPRFVAKLARKVSAKRSYDAKPGDFAVVRLDRQWFCAIRSNDGFWIIKAHSGVIALRDCRVVAAWSL